MYMIPPSQFEGAEGGSLMAVAEQCKEQIAGRGWTTRESDKAEDQAEDH